MVVALQSRLASVSKRFKSVLEVMYCGLFLSSPPMPRSCAASPLLSSPHGTQLRTKFMKEAKDRRSQYFDTASTFAGWFLH